MGRGNVKSNYEQETHSKLLASTTTTTTTSSSSSTVVKEVFLLHCYTRVERQLKIVSSIISVDD